MILGTAISVARWLTWEPYGALLIGYDLVISVLGLALLFALLGTTGATSQDHRLLRAARCGLICLVYGLLFNTALWIDCIHGTGQRALGNQSWHFAAVAVVGIVFLGRTLRPGRSRSLLGFHAALVLPFCLGLDRHEAWPAFSLIFPATLALLLLFGLPGASLPSKTGARVSLLGCAAALLVCALTLAPGSNTRLPRPASAELTTPPASSVILLVVDTLRRDHLSLYGYERQTSPQIDRWAKQGLVFEDMTATSSWTLPSHASMLTGLYPRSHGAHGLRAHYTWGNSYLLAETQDTLAEYAREADIATGAIIANHFYLSRKWGLDQGFDTYWTSRPRRGLRFAPTEWLTRQLADFSYTEFAWSYYRDRYITDHAIQWLRWHQDLPFFLLLNYMDPHTPSYREPCEAVPAGDELSFREHSYDIWPVPGQQPPPNVLRDIVNNYDREILHLDAELARLFQFLEESGLDERTTVVLTSDHGEYFGERDLWFHSKALHNEVVNVPLVVHGPTITPGRSDKPVQSVDLFPTITDLLGLEIRPVQGASVLGDEQHPIVSEWYQSESGILLQRVPGRFERDLRTIRDGSLRLIASSRGGQEHELYEIAGDPTETHDLSADRARVEDLTKKLQRWMAKHPPAAKIAQDRSSLDQDDLDAAQELGYKHDD